MTAKAHTSTLVAALKSTLKSRDLTYRDLATKLDLSEASVKRLFAEETFTLKRLEEICNVLEIDFFELARIARGASADVDEMSDKQEQLLADDPKLLGIFHLLFNEWTVDAILDTYELTKAECTALLLKLDKAGIIELGANDHVRLKVPRTVRLQRKGPIERTHGKSVVADFISADFAAEGGYFAFEFRELSQTSIAHLERKLARLAQEFHELAELDGYLPAQQRKTIGMAVGIRPWGMWWVTGLKRRDANEQVK